MIEELAKSSPQIIEAVSKYKIGFILLVLVACVIYQFIDGNIQKDRRDDEIRRLNEVIRIKDEKAFEYEKERGARYEFLLNNLPKVKDENQK